MTMQITISTVVSSERIEGQTRFVVQTIGNPTLRASDALLKTALQRVANEARKQLEKWSSQGRTREIANWLYDPNAITQLIKEPITLRDQTLSIKTIIIAKESNGVFIVRTPLINDLKFQSLPRESINQAAIRVITGWCEEAKRDDRSIDLTELSITGDAWIEPLDITLPIGEKKPKKSKGPKGSLLGQPNPGGAESLQRVGRCLDSFRQERCNVYCRDVEIDRVTTVLGTRRKQSLLLVGPSGVGKSAILNEVVRRRVQGRKNNEKHLQQVWLISPNRVISGMSYLGQWEERWLSILKEAYKNDHVLYFDDPIGLYTAGITKDSELCLADVLKSFIAEHPIRMVFEVTNEALSILRRKDRALVDPMIPIAVEPMNEAGTLRTLTEVVSRIEAENRCFFHPGVLPAIIECSSLVAPHQSLPGKAISLAIGVSHSHGNAANTHSIVVLDNTAPQDDKESSSRSITGVELNHFIQERTGLRLSMRYERKAIEDLEYDLSHMIVGQPRAVSVLARYAKRSMQGLQPPDRPLGVFLFTGPTGVGKTESAKALTNLLFFDPTRLVRIDMNEVTSADAAETLIGTLDQPDGRLPSSMRRQPNCVLLLDEIEKAHPDVLDYLLQVMGEGRLSDARGRTVDFRNAFIIMTSNIGSAEGNQSFGYDTHDSSSHASKREMIFQRAAKQHFRPEFLNRIDEIVVFDRLQRDHMRFIADHHMSELKRRDGLSRRKIFLQVDPEATDWVIAKGYDAALGARAIKRAIEREVAQPLADQLAACHVEHPVWTQIRVVSNQLRCETQPLTILTKPHSPLTNSIHDSLELGKNCLERMRNELQSRSASQPGVVNPLGTVDYYSIHSAIMESSDLLKEIKEKLVADKESAINPVQNPIKTPKSKTINNPNRGLDPLSLHRHERRSALGMRETLKESSNTELARADEASLTRMLVRSLALSDLMLKRIDSPKRWLLRVRFLNPPHGIRSGYDAELYQKRLLLLSPSFANHMTNLLGALFSDLQYAAEIVPDLDMLIVEGASVAGVIEPLLGTYQVQGRIGIERLLMIEAKPITQNVDPTNIAELKLEAASFIHSQNGFPNDEYCGPNGWSTIRGQIDEWITDFRTGSRVTVRYSNEWPGWLLDQLPAPSEFQSQSPDNAEYRA